MKQLVLSPLKLEWHRPSVSKLSRYQFLESLGFKSKNKIIEWPRNILDMVDFAAQFGAEAGTLLLSKLIDKGHISVTAFMGKREAPKNISSCIILFGKTFEPIYIRKSRNAKVFVVVTRNNTKYMDYKSFAQMIRQLSSQMYINTPIIYFR